MATKSLCELCLLPKTRSCRAYIKNPEACVVDCGRFDPNKDLPDFYERVSVFLNNQYHKEDRRKNSK